MDLCFCMPVWLLSAWLIFAAVVSAVLSAGFCLWFLIPWVDHGDQRPWRLAVGITLAFAAVNAGVYAAHVQPEPPMPPVIVDGPDGDGFLRLWTSPQEPTPAPVLKEEFY